MTTVLIADDHPLFREALRGAGLRKLGASNRTQAVLIAGRLAVEPGALAAQPDEQ